MKPLLIISAIARFLVVGCLIFLRPSLLHAADSAGVDSAKPASSSSTNLLTRTFKVDPNTFTQGLPLVADSKTTNVTERFQNFIATFGVDFQPPKALFINERQGVVFVRGSLADLDTIEQVLQSSYQVPPQVNIRAKFLEMKGNGKGDPLFSFLSSLSPQPAIWISNSARSNSVRPLGTNNPTFTAILNLAQLKVVLRALERRQDTELLSAPDATTISGRQAKIRVMQIRTIVTGEDLQEDPFGPKLDVVPYVSADGFTVNMMLIPTVTEFVGYQKPGRVPAKLAREKFVKTEPPLPIYRERQVVTSATVWDGQTIVIGGFPSENVTYEAGGSKIRKRDPKAQKRRLYVFITPTIIDPAGNRVHSDEQIPTHESYPPQQPISSSTPR